MKIRDQRLIAAAGWCGTQIARVLSTSIRFDTHSLSTTPVDPLQPPEQGAYIYALWHENFLIPIARYGNPRLAALVSSHADGQLLGSLLRATGISVVHGSTSRGGVAALRQLIRRKKRPQHLAVTPDGPRGPRRQVQPGIVYLASRSAMRIVPVGVGHCRPWRMSSWDRFVIPRPLSRVRCVFGEAITVPGQLSVEALDPYLAQVQDTLESLSDLAENWAESGQLQLPVTVLQSRIRVPALQQPSPSFLNITGKKRGVQS